MAEIMMQPESAHKSAALTDPDFQAFLQILSSDEVTRVSAPKALEAVKDNLGLGRLTVELVEVPAVFLSQGELHKRVLFDNPEGADETKAYSNAKTTADGGLASFCACPVPGHTFSEIQKRDLEAICECILVHAGRYHLLKMAKRNALTNYITGLPNSGGYIQAIEDRVSMGIVQEYDGFYFNIRGFGLVNQQFGRLEGDEIVRRFAKAVADKIKPGEVLAHLGGDNFTALIYKEHREDFINFLLVQETYGMKQEEKIPVTLYSTIGVFPILPGATSPDVMTGSSAALNQARNEKKEVLILTEEMYQEITLTKILTHDFPSALESEALRVYYQPKVDTRDGKILGAEALVRWEHSDRIIPPVCFISMLERSGHSLALDLYMLRHVCADIRNWKGKEEDRVPISVNFSRSDLNAKGYKAKDIAKLIHEVIEEAGIRSELIIIEVTETTDAQEQKQLFEFMSELKNYGIATSIDDFGTGYSSLSILRDFPINEIKIDRSFINHKELGEHDEIILHSIISMAKSLGLSIITEGVENEEQVFFLRKMGCDHVQGYLYDKPLPREEWEKRLETGPYPAR